MCINSTNNTHFNSPFKTPPYLMYKTKPDSNGDPLIGNNRFEGYCAELAKEIARQCNFDYIIKPVADGKYGALLDNGKWDGMVKELTENVTALYLLFSWGSLFWRQYLFSQVT